MFETLTERLSNFLRNVSGQGQLTPENIDDAMREVRMALLEADVALPVVKQFIEDVQQKALGQEVMQSLSPGQALIKVVYDELVSILGDVQAEINLQVAPPAVILVAGLQGSGKTTTVAKLARYLKERKNKKVLITSTDVYRPAAREQLHILAQEISAESYFDPDMQQPLAIANTSIAEAKRRVCDVVIIDTAGRLHIDSEMMQEIRIIHAAINPIETLFVVDSMTGQDAAVTAKAFGEALPLTGVILTKVDGDARGGAALSVRIITGKPIKFIGVGEKTDALEPFYPDRIASRILGMGDILTLIEEAEEKLDRTKTKQLAKKLQKGKSFDLEDFRDQLQQMKKMGGMTNLLAKLPGMGGLPQNLKDKGV